LRRAVGFERSLLLALALWWPVIAWAEIVEGALHSEPLLREQSARDRAIDMFSQLRGWEYRAERAMAALRKLNRAGACFHRLGLGHDCIRIHIGSADGSAACMRADACE
jgi:hypothetical protein